MTTTRTLAVTALAGAVAVAVNLAIRAAVLAALDQPDVPRPLVLGADVVFTFVPCLLGGLVFVVLRRRTTRPVYWFTLAAAAVVVLSWAAPLAGWLGGGFTAGLALGLSVMHVTPAVVLVAALRRTVHSRQS